MRPSHQAVVPALPLLSKSCGRVRAEVEGALLPAHHRRVEHRQQRRPRLGVGGPRRRRRAAPSRCRRRPAHLDRLERRERGADAPWCRPATRRGRPPCPGRRPQPAARPARRSPPRPSAAGVPRRASPASGPPRACDEPPVAVVAPRGPAPRRPRTWVSTRGADRARCAVLLARRQLEPPLEQRAPARGSPGRSDLGPRERRRAPPPWRARATRHRRRPGRPSRPPWPAGPPAWPATRADALPHAAGSRSGEDEQGAPHGQLLDQRAVVVQRPLDVGHGHAVDPGPDER